MRLVTVLAALAIAAPAAAGPKEESRALYDVVVESAATFVVLMDRVASEEPAVVADAIKEGIVRPLSGADSAWMAAMTDAGPEPFLPFFPCREAAVSLDAIAGKFVVFLREETGRPDVALDVGYFREDLTRCEAALGIPQTFDDPLQGLTD